MSSFHEWHPDFELKPARSMAIIVTFFHGLTLIGVCWGAIDQGVQTLIGLTVVVSLLLSLLLSLWWSLGALGYHHAAWVGVGSNLFGRRQIDSVFQKEGGVWQLGMADGSTLSCSLMGSSVISRYIICLSFKPIGQPFGFSVPLLITADRLSAQDYRRLLVWLRWQSEQALSVKGSSGRGGGLHLGRK